MSKVKVQISINDDLFNDLNLYCEKNFINRSSAVSQAISRMINEQKMVNAITDVSIAIKKAADVGKISDETKKELEAFETLCKIFIGK